MYILGWMAVRPSTFTIHIFAISTYTVKRDLVQCQKRPSYYTYICNIYLSIYLSIYLYWIYIYVYLSIYLSILDIHICIYTWAEASSTKHILHTHTYRLYNV